MSQTSPVSLAFDMQRNAIEQTQQAFTRSLDAQRAFGEAFVDMAPSKQITQQSFDAARTALDVYFDAIEATVPGTGRHLDDARTTVEEQLDTLEATQTQAFESVESSMEHGTGAVDESLEAFVDALDEQVKTLLESHEDIETRTVETLEEFEGSFEELRTEFESQGEIARKSVDAQLEQFETQMSEMLRQLETVSEQIADVADKQVSTQVEVVEVTSDSLEAINGLGPTYADRLVSIGIESIEALAEANAEAVAEATDVTEEKATQWIESAQSWE